MKTIKHIIVAILLLTTICMHAQVGIGTKNPDPSSALDITSTNKGLLIPRVALTGLTDKITINEPANSLLVYNTAIAGSNASAVTPGYYYWNGTTWVKFVSTSSLDFRRIESNFFSKNVDGSFGNKDDTGINNIFLGTFTRIEELTRTGTVPGSKNTTGGNNIFIGSKAGIVNTTGNNNLFMGYRSGLSNVTGNSNIFMGPGAGNRNITGSFNLFMGELAGFRNYSNNNVFLGYEAGTKNTTGANNNFIGSQAGNRNETGVSNSFLGFRAGYSNTAGDFNTFSGNEAGFGNTTGDSNTFLGNNTAKYNTTGSGNIAIGDDAGNHVSGGRDRNKESSNSIFLGKETKSGASNATNEIVIGDSAEGAGTNTVTLGNTKITDTYLHGNTFVLGTSAQLSIGTPSPDASSVLDISSNNKGLLIPRIALVNGLDQSTIERPTKSLLVYNTATAGQFNLAITPGYYFWKDTGAGWTRLISENDLGFRLIGDSYFSKNSNGSFTTNGNSDEGNRNIFLGEDTGIRTTEGANNIFMGYQSGRANTKGDNNIFMGNLSGTANTEGGNNIFTGFSAGKGNTTGDNNIFMGNLSGAANTEGKNNVFLGSTTGLKNTTGGFNTFLGNDAALNNKTGSDNVAIGNNAGNLVSGGINQNQESSSSVFLGNRTKSGASNSTNEIVIGDSAEGVGTNTVTIGNTEITDTYLRGNIFVSGTQKITPDYVFEKYYNGFSSLKEDYKMMSLKKVAAFTRKNKHLPGVLSAKEVKKQGGVILNHETTINLEKIEELFLHAIAQEKELEAKDKKIKELESSLSIQQKELEKIKAFLKLK
ncbi:MAG: hypothetical protein ACWIPJ_06005 [Polaribacter sp.]